MTDPTVIDLLSDVDAYLCALHVHGARHDQIGVDLTCGGCVLRDRIAAALSQLAAVPPADQTTDRAALRDRIADVVIPLLLDTLPKVIARSRGYEVADAVLAVLPEPADRAAVLREAADIAESLRQFEPATGARKSAQVSENVGILRVAEELCRLAAEAQPTTKPDEDPARIDRLRPEFFEHASVESIDLQIQRARRQQRHWGNRERTLAILRQARVTQKERGEWPAAGARQDGAQP